MLSKHEEQRPRRTRKVYRRQHWGVYSEETEDEDKDERD